MSAVSGDTHQKELKALKSKCKSICISKIMLTGKFCSISKCKYFTIETLSPVFKLQNPYNWLNMQEHGCRHTQQSFWKFTDSSECLISSCKTFDKPQYQSKERQWEHCLGGIGESLA